MPLRIECIDISNLQSSAIVASKVCFLEGRPAKDQYRKYKVRSQVEHHDDYGSIREVVERSLRRSIEEGELPDLLVIDGGKGQLNAALDARRMFPDLDLKIVGLAKARTSYESDTHWSKSFERIFVEGSDVPLSLKEGSPEFRLMTQLRDEAHRFAIRFHRKTRGADSIRSALDAVPGVGKALKKRLLTEFESIDAIKAAGAERLATVKGVSLQLATRILDALKD